MPVAVDLAKAFGGQLHVTTIVRDVDAMWQTQYSLSAYEKMIDEAAARLNAIIDELVPQDLKPHSTVGHGNVFGEILRIARDTGTELIVMASHRPEMKDYLIGSNAARVVRHATCSVLVVRES